MPEPSKSLVMVVAAQQDEYGSRIWAGARSVLEAAGLSVLVHLQARPDVCMSGSLRQILRLGSLCGVILTPLVDTVAEDEVAAETRRVGLPTVAVAYNRFPGPCVLGDSTAGMRALMRHLIEDCGVCRPVFIRGKTNQIDAVERERIFRAELDRYGIPMDEDLVVEGMFWHDTAYHAMRRLLSGRRDMDAVVAANDLSAFGALRALREAGLRIPQDVRLTGFDNQELASSTLPALTTVDQETTEQGRVAALQLLRLIDGEPCDSTVVVPSSLVVRGSTRPTTASVDDLTDIASTTEIQMAELGAISSLSRSLAKARNLDDMLAELTACLSWVGVDRFYLAVHQPGVEREAVAQDEQVQARLVFAYSHGTVSRPPEDTFPAHQLLPAALLPELAGGLLAVQPLERAEREIGYMLFDRARGTITTSEIFQVNISRTIDAILSAQELADHAADLEELVARRTQELESEVGTRRAAEKQLQRANAELQRLAMVDGLTGIANRAALEQHLNRHWELCVRDEVGVCVVLVDVDFFKPFNDRYGHLRGDDALRMIASCLERAVSGPNDLACRYGGEEFIAVLPGCDLPGARAMAERFRTLLARAAIPHATSTVSPIVTASVGIANETAAGGTAMGLVGAADEALYRAKSSGRNCVRVCERPRPGTRARPVPAAGAQSVQGDPTVPTPRRPPVGTGTPCETAPALLEPPP
jgi:diguanylate cyclase (GGDEF)-like protein